MKQVYQHLFKYSMPYIDMWKMLKSLFTIVLLYCHKLVTDRNISGSKKGWRECWRIYLYNSERYLLWATL